MIAPMLHRLWPLVRQLAVLLALLVLVVASLAVGVFFIVGSVVPSALSPLDRIAVGVLGWVLVRYSFLEARAARERAEQLEHELELQKELGTRRAAASCPHCGSALLATTKQLERRMVFACPTRTCAHREKYGRAYTELSP